MEKIEVQYTDMQIFMGILTVASAILIIVALYNIVMMFECKTYSIKADKENIIGIAISLPLALISFIVPIVWRANNISEKTEEIQSICNYEYDGYDIITSEHRIHSKGSPLLSTDPLKFATISDTNTVTYKVDTKGNITEITEITLTENVATDQGIVTITNVSD